MDKSETIIVLEEEQKKRLDKLLSDRFLKSRTYFQYLIKKGCIVKNDQKVFKNSEKVNTRDKIKI